MRFLVLTILCACSGVSDPVPDAALEIPDPCCALLPDMDAVRTCEPPLPANTCGVIACPMDGGFARVNVCGPRTDP